MTDRHKELLLTLRRFVGQLPETELAIFVMNYERLEREWHVGPCTLRARTRQFLRENSTTCLPDESYWMREMMFEAYRRLAEPEYRRQLKKFW